MCKTMLLLSILLLQRVYGFSTCITHHTIKFHQHQMAAEDDCINIPPPIINSDPVRILHSGAYHLVVEKPPSVVCHHSGWAGLRSRKKNNEIPIEIPMLQRVRDTVGRRVNLVHRLDRGASGALLFTYAENDEESSLDAVDIDELDDASINSETTAHTKKGPTAAFIQSLASTEAQKTYVAIVRGEGILHGEDFKTMGWFPVSRPIRNDRGVLKDATTMIRFISGQSEGNTEYLNDDPDALHHERPRLSLVLARPLQGRWHQIRKHLNGLSHPILGDSSHGHSRLNREWRDKRGLSYERTCLHLARIHLPPAEPYTTEALDVTCPIAEDMVNLLEKYAPHVFDQAKPILREEGIIW